MKPSTHRIDPEPPRGAAGELPGPAGAAEPAEPYQPPRLIVHDSDEFIRSLGPAQACSPSPIL